MATVNYVTRAIKGLQVDHDTRHISGAGGTRIAGKSQFGGLCGVKAQTGSRRFISAACRNCAARLTDYPVGIGHLYRNIGGHNSVNACDARRTCERKKTRLETRLMEHKASKKSDIIKNTVPEEIIVCAST